MTENQTPAGWYADPAGDPTKIRYWDGQNWTEQLKDANAAAPAYTPATPMPSYGVTQGAPVDPYNPAPQQQTYNYQQTNMAAGGKDQKGLAIAGLVCGIVGILGGIFIPILGLILGVLGVTFGTKGRKSSAAKLGTAGFIVGIVAIAVSCLSWAVSFMYLMGYI